MNPKPKPNSGANRSPLSPSVVVAVLSHLSLERDKEGKSLKKWGRREGWVWYLECGRSNEGKLLTLEIGTGRWERGIGALEMGPIWRSLVRTNYKSIILGQRRRMEDSEERCWKIAKNYMRNII